MSKSHRVRKNIGDASRPTIIQASITEVGIREYDNMIVCEVVDNLGNYHRGVETIMQGGGTPDNFTSIPYTVGQEVYLLQTSHNETPYIIGSVFKPAFIEPSRDTEFSDTGEDRNVIGVRDYVISNRGNIINLTDEYGVVLSANKDIRLQLGNEGILRISKNGLCDDFPLRGAAFITALHNYLEEIRDIQDQMKEMQTNITDGLVAIKTALSGMATTMNTPVGGGPPGGPGSVAAAATALATAMTAASTPIDQADAQDTALQALPIRDKEIAGQESVETICTSIRLPKTPE